MNASFETAGELAYDNLYAGEFPRVTTLVTVAEGADLKRGTVVALDSAGKAVPVNSEAGSAGDPRRDPYGVLVADVDATNADTEGLVYLAGHFNELALTFGGTDDADDHRAALRTLGIFITKNMGA